MMVNKNEIVELKRKPNLYEITVIANEDDFDFWGELKRINELFKNILRRTCGKNLF